MAEGLSPVEVGKSLGEHAEAAKGGSFREKNDRTISIIEAVLLAVVAVLAAWSGFSSAKWSTDSRLYLAQASTARNESTQADLDANTLKNFDASTFNAWFTAYVAGNKQAEHIAERRFRPKFAVAFDAWIETDPMHNPQAPPGPTYMPQYKQPELAHSAALSAKANNLAALGAATAGYSDNYVLTTVYLATVLFLVGISGHFRYRGLRIGLISVAFCILCFAVVVLVTAPKPQI
jgi:hypothetical protein